MPWISDRLRQPDGCPWDREQTHASLRNHLLEEAYEVYDALEGGATPELADELGDLLLQVILHAQLAAEDGVFDLADVQAAIARKIVRRHPHVFGEAEAETARTSTASGSGSRPRNARTPAATAAAKSALDGISRSMPALAASQEMQERAAHLGYDWPSIDGVLDKVIEETEELREAAADGDDRAWAEEFGDLLFVLVNVARRQDIDAEAAMRAANDKFRRRFASVERQAAERGVALRDMDFARSTRCGMRPRQRRRRRHEHRQSPDGPSRRTRPPRPPTGELHARRPEVGRGLVPRPRRRHRGPVRGHDRRPGPAAPPRQGDRLGHRRVLDAAARHRGAHASASPRRAGSAGARTRSSASSAAPCAASSTSTRSASARSPSTATCSRPTAAPARRRSPAATSRSRPRSSPTAWSATWSARWPRSPSAVDGVPLLDLDYSEDSRADVDFNVVGTDSGAYVELQGTAEGRPFDRGAADGLIDMADAGLAQLFAAQAAILATVRR